MSLECEAKLVAPADFELPGFDGLVTGIVAAPAVRRKLDAAYYDSADLLLARCGVTLRHRTGEVGPAWTLKLPESQTSAALVRRELVFEGPAGAVPALVQDLLRGYLRSRPLQQVARLCTDRTAVRLCDQAACPVAEVVDDVVTVYQGHRRTGQFREVEVEVIGDDQARSDLLHAAVDTLVATGCHAEPPMPKLVRALGAAAATPSDLEPPKLGKKPTVVRLIQRTLATSVARMVRHDAGVRLGDDPEDVHQFRVATRRLRSDLQTFASVLDRDWVGGLRAELRWLGGEVGGVRDNDVLSERLHAQVTSLPAEDAEAADGLLKLLTEQGHQARVSMLHALRTSRYDALVDAVCSATRHPVLADDAGESARRPAESFVAEVMCRQWKRLLRSVISLDDPPSDEDLHRIRILAKRCRYAAEMTIPVIGRRAARFAAAIAEVQTVLGDHHDAAVAEGWLRAAAAVVPASAVAAGQLIAMQRADSARLRLAWPAVWASASAKKLRDWF